VHPVSRTFSEVQQLFLQCLQSRADACRSVLTRAQANTQGIVVKTRQLNQSDLLGLPCFLRHHYTMQTTRISLHTMAPGSVCAGFVVLHPISRSGPHSSLLATRGTRSTRLRRSNYGEQHEPCSHGYQIAKQSPELSAVACAKHNDTG
jgi:hypothetical protein